MISLQVDFQSKSKLEKSNKNPNPKQIRKMTQKSRWIVRTVVFTFAKCQVDELLNNHKYINIIVIVCNHDYNYNYDYYYNYGYNNDYNNYNYDNTLNKTQLRRKNCSQCFSEVRIIQHLQNQNFCHTFTKSKQ